MTAEEYYKKEFKKEYELIENLKEQPFFNFRSMMEFSELYHQAKLKELEEKKISDLEIQKHIEKNLREKYNISERQAFFNGAEWLRDLSTKELI